jgi:hypothetical protein
MNLLLAVLLASVGAEPGPSHDHGPQIGKVSFETSCTPQANALFHSGLGWLHSFE